MSTTPRPIISDAALLAAWAAVPVAERHSFVCMALAEDVSYQLLAALAERQPETPAPLPDAEGLRESEENSARNRAGAGPAPDTTEAERARRREAARRHRERRRAAQAAPAAD